MTTAAVGEAVVSALADVLERDPETIHPERPLAELGVDSLVRVEIAERVEADLAGAVRITDEELDAAPTVAALVAGFRPRAEAR